MLRIHVSKIIITLLLFVFFTGCAKSYDELAFVGQYYIEDEIGTSIGRPVLVLDKDGKCEFKISYFQGICTATGTFYIDKKLLVLTLLKSEPDGFIGEKYLEGTKNQIHISPDQYFTIIDKNTLQINDDVYAIEQGTMFIRVNKE